MSIADNLAEVRQRTESAARKAGADPASITLIAVTKTVDTPVIREGIAAGITDIGENYVQDSARKFEEIGHAVKWHMIGHLQTNKVRQAVPIFDLIQSVDSLRLAKELAKRSAALGKTSHVLVEVNISREESKTGAAPSEVLGLCESIAGIDGVELAGLMGIAPFVEDKGDIRRSFAELRSLWEKLPSSNRKHLSMGMSADFEIAIEEGSNMVRVGTAIFGTRPRKR